MASRTTAIIVGALLMCAPSAAAGFPEVAGWTADDEVQTYGPDNLWEYINGAADQYIAFGFHVLKARNLSSGGVTVTVNLYDMGSDLNAYGLYRSERSDAGTSVSVGAGAMVSPPYQCLLVKGRHYVKIDAYDGEITEELGRGLVEGIAAALPGDDGLPEALRALPAQGMVEGSAGFTREGFLGLSELTDCAHASYTSAAGQDYQVFHLIAGEGTTTQSIWDGLAGKWIAVEHAGDPVLARKVPYRGLVGIIRTSSGIYGVADAPGKAEMLELLAGLAR